MARTDRNGNFDPKNGTIAFMASTKKPASQKTKKPATKSTGSKKNATSKKPASLRVNFRRPALTKAVKRYFLPFLGATAVAFAAVFWYYKIYADPQKVFWGMVENNLSTKGLTKGSSQSTGSFEGSELYQISFNPTVGVRNVRDVVDHTQQPPTHVTMEALGTANADYQHYILIDRPAAEGKKKADYSKVYNMWLSSGEGNAQLISSQLFGPFLFGDFSQNLRSGMINDLKKAYKVNFASSHKLNLNGRTTFAYDVEVGLHEYAKAAQKYARALGLGLADQIDPASYPADAKTNVTVYVDALSRQVRKLEYRGNSSEDYQSYGVPVKINPPKQVVTSEEFQKALDSASEQ